MTTATPPRAAAFAGPGRPRPLAHRLAIHNQALQQVRGFLADEEFNEVPVSALAALSTACEATDTSFPVDHCGHLAFARQSAQLDLDSMLARGFPAVWCESESLRREWKADERHLTGFKLVEAARRDLDLDGLVDFMVRLLRHVAGNLGANLLGGRTVTRLDRVLRMEPPRLTYREALAVLNERGWSMPFGEDLHRDAEASLVRYVGHGPLLVTHQPASLKPFNMRRDPADPEVTLSVELILPWAGETADGGVLEADRDLLSERLKDSDLLQQQQRHAGQLAMRQVATRPAGAEGPDTDELAARHRSALDGAWNRYLDLFAKPLERGHVAVGFARLLQWVQGLETVSDAVIGGQDRNSFGAPIAGSTGADADNGAVTA